MSKATAPSTQSGRPRGRPDCVLGAVALLIPLPIVLQLAYGSNDSGEP